MDYRQKNKNIFMDVYYCEMCIVAFDLWINPDGSGSGCIYTGVYVGDLLCGRNKLPHVFVIKERRRENEK